jgi:scyllo-inositol 2-dehydrogenase (NADP+)
MKLAIIGLGVQGRKRRAVAGDHVRVVVDPVAPADYRRVEDVPLERYEAACVCVPDQEKLPLLRYLLGHGKHVLVEKPLLVEPGEIRELQALARARRLVCYTAYNHRFEPHIMRIREVLLAGTIGPVYLARMFYGNGTARDVRNSPWRDHGLGVLPDLGSHLLDTALFLFGPLSGSSRVWSLNRFENKAPDHVLFGLSGPPLFEAEATFLSWRNTFTFDVFGELGSAHIHCLCKWGPSTLTVRRRILPSGRPEETVKTLEQPDPTWQAEYAHFLELCRTGGDNLENDLWIRDKLAALTAGASAPQQ